jgi:hypothetical protein
MAYGFKDMLTGVSTEAVSDSNSDSNNRDVIAWRYATAADILEFYGKLPRQTIRAIVLTRNGVPEVIGGVARDAGGVQRFFSDHTESIVPHLKSITAMRGLKALMKLVKGYPGVVLAIAQDDVGEKLLTRLGFVHIDEDVYAGLGLH